MNYIIQVELLDKVLEDAKRKQEIQANLNEGQTFETRVLPLFGMKYRLENGAIITVKETLSLQKRQLTEPDCIIFVD